MRTRLILAMVGLAFLLGVPDVVMADFLCGSGSISFSNSSTTELDGNVTIMVTCTTVNGQTQLGVQVASSSISSVSPQGIDKFAYGNSTSVLSVSGNASAWSPEGTHQADGFGSFASEVYNGPAETGGTSSPLTFTLNGNPTTFFVNSPQGAAFAAHVRFTNNCSGWFGDGSPNHLSSSAECSSVPEPGTLTLLGTGLFGIARRLRRRLVTQPDEESPN